MASKKTAAAEDVTAATAEQDELARTVEEQEQGTKKLEPSAGGQEQSAQEPEQETQEPEQETQEPEQVTLVYIGPSIPYEKMRSSMILKGTEEEIGSFLKEIKEKYPEVTHLLVPPERLTDALEKVARKGTILHKYYEDMLAKSRASRKG